MNATLCDSHGGIVTAEKARAAKGDVLRRPRYGPPPCSPKSGGQSARSAIELLLEIFEFVTQSRVGLEFPVDLADRMQDRCVIAVAGSFAP